MITRILYSEEQKLYDSVIKHPVQTWAWGEFQQSQGHKIYRLGVFDEGKIIYSYSVSFHKIPKTNYSVGTLLRGPKIDEEMIKNIKKIAVDENAIFVKFEPDVFQKKYHPEGRVEILSDVPQFPDLKISPKVAFYPFTYVLDLSKTEDELLASTNSKTRYNIRLANRHNVTISQQTNDQGFEIYLKLLFDTTRRQGFYLHSEKYHRDLWKIIKNTDIPHIMLADYQGQTLAAFMLFALKDKLFYPYGASTDTHRSVMAPNLLMWESIKLGQKLKLKTFDLWGSLGPDAKEGELGFGFHRFKQGYGGDLMEFVGTYDLIIKPQLYSLYNTVDKYRWKLLRLKSRFIR